MADPFLKIDIRDANGAKFFLERHLNDIVHVDAECFECLGRVDRTRVPLQRLERLGELHVGRDRIEIKK